MNSFPTLKTGAIFQYPATRALDYKTCVLKFIDGSEQRFREYAAPARRWAVRLDLLDEEEMAALENFIASVEGRFGEFSFTDPWEGTVYNRCGLAEDSPITESSDLERGRALLVIEEKRY